jgi:ABC-type bacteriocin/lantibiotic exporter with double-glycine peptidase domain
VILDVPVVLQTSGYDCGTAAARAVFRFHGRQLPDLSALGVPSPIDGTDPRVLEAVCRRAGFGVESGESRLDTLRHHVREGRPAQVLVQRDGCGHWAVVCGVARGRVHLMDPSSGPAVLPVAQFEASWRDVCRDGTLYYRWAVVPSL